MAAENLSIDADDVRMKLREHLRNLKCTLKDLLKKGDEMGVSQDLVVDEYIKFFPERGLDELLKSTDDPRTVATVVRVYLRHALCPETLKERLEWMASTTKRPDVFEALVRDFFTHVGVHNPGISIEDILLMCSNEDFRDRLLAVYEKLIRP